MTGRNLLVVVYTDKDGNPKNLTKDGKTQYADVQLDARDPLAVGQTNLHATTRRDKAPDGSDRYSNGAPYSVDQFTAIQEAAAGNVAKVPTKDGGLAEVYGVKADIMPATRGSGLVINTKKEMGTSAFTVDGDVLSNQIAAVREAKAAKDAAAPALEAEAEAQAETPAVDEPEV